MRGLSRLGLVVLLLTLISCGQSSPGGVLQYTVTAPMLATPGKPAYACYSELASLPPAGCSGVQLENVAVSTIPGAITYENGTVETPMVTLVGTWNGRQLKLTRPPAPSQNRGSAPRPVPQAPPTKATGTAQQIDDQIAHDMPALQLNGIQILWFGIGVDGVDVLLAVADDTSVRTMYGKYGQVHISGWLQTL